MTPYEAFACRCRKGNVVLRESYQPNTRSKLYYACLRSKPKENDYGCKFFYRKRNESVYYSVLWDLHGLQVISQNIHYLIAIPQEVQHHKNHQSGTSISGGCSNCKHLLGKIKVLEAAVEMHMHPEKNTRNSTALLHELHNDMDNLDLE
nr:hypothetical protein [Tanacetum cinerariifolium]